MCGEYGPILPSIPSLLMSASANTGASYLAMIQGTRRCKPTTMDRFVAPPLVVFHWSLAFDDHMLQIIRFGLKVKVCPYTRSDDLMVLVWPILASLVPVPVPNPNGVVNRTGNHIDEIAIIHNPSRFLYLRNSSSKGY